MSSTVLSQTLENSTVLLTGAGGELGRSICAALSAAGARVVATDIGDIPSDSPSDLWMQHDVTSASAWTHVIDTIGARFGRLDCLINNAAICPLAPITEISLEQWRRVSSVNVESILLGLQTALPLLRQSGGDRVGGASVVNMSSAAGLRGSPFAAAYSASKGAVTLLTKSAAKEFASLKYPIRVNSVHPGSLESPMMNANLERLVEIGAAASLDAAKASFASRNPMGRLGRPSEIAGTVVFLCSPAASFMTGSSVIIDGGTSA